MIGLKEMDTKAEEIIKALGINQENRDSIKNILKIGGIVFVAYVIWKIWRIVNEKS